MVRTNFNRLTDKPGFISFFNHFDKNELNKHDLFPAQAVLFHRNLYDTLGGFDEELEVFAGWELWTRYSKMTEFLSVEKTTSEFRIPKIAKLNKEESAKLDQTISYIQNKHDIKV